MLQVRRDREIHREDGGWFVARWHFSFDRYRDPQQMGVGPLRVFNHDQLAPGAVWPMHPHADSKALPMSGRDHSATPTASATTASCNRVASN
jgi:redox-sensitive bicupin YhaK (pirin superfamily)